MRKKLKGCNANFENAIKIKKKELAMELDKIDKLSEASRLSAINWHRLQECRSELNTILKEEEIKWLQRSREKELLEGDNNTKYYHAKANGRRRKNRIVSLNQEDGVIEGQENLKNYITDFYKSLFGESGRTSVFLDPRGVVRISEEDGETLMKKIRWMN